MKVTEIIFELDVGIVVLMVNKFTTDVVIFIPYLFYSDYFH